MTQLTEQDLATIKELINNNTQLILQKIEALSDNVDVKLEALSERVERIEKNNDRVSTALLITILSVGVIGVIKWVFFGLDSLS